jgi:predicted Zn-dependent peptidase
MNNFYARKLEDYKTYRVIFTYYLDYDEDKLAELIYLTHSILNKSNKYKYEYELLNKQKELYILSAKTKSSINDENMGLCITFDILSTKYRDDITKIDIYNYIKEIIYNSLIDEEVFKKVRLNFENQIKIDEKESRIVNAINFKEIFLGDKTSILTLKNKLELVTREDVINFYSDMIQHNNKLDIMLVGNYNEKEKEVYSSFITLEEQIRVISIPNNCEHKGTIINHFKDNKSTDIIIGYDTKKLTLRDKLIGSVFARILGNGMDSILFQEIREKHSKCYVIAAGFEYVKECLIVQTLIDNKIENKDFVLNKIDEIITNFKVDEEKVKHAINNILDNPMYDLFTINDNIKEIELFKQYNLTFQDFKEIYKTITVEEVNNFKDKLIHKLTLILTGGDYGKKNN